MALRLTHVWASFCSRTPIFASPTQPKYYSVNQGYERKWSPAVQGFTSWLQGDNERGMALSLRYIGSLVADFHRNLLAGGVFYYPAEGKGAKKAAGQVTSALRGRTDGVSG